MFCQGLQRPLHCSNITELNSLVKLDVLPPLICFALFPTLCHLVKSQLVECLSSSPNLAPILLLDLLVLTFLINDVTITCQLNDIRPADFWLNTIMSFSPHHKSFFAGWQSDKLTKRLGTIETFILVNFKLIRR